MSRKNRDKGLNFEREVARLFERAGWKGARRMLEYHAKDAKGIDLQHTEPFKVQCKKTAKYVPLSTINEIQCDREFGEIPVLVAAGNNQEPMAVLPLSDFMKLVREHRAWAPRAYSIEVQD